MTNKDVEPFWKKYIGFSMDLRDIERELYREWVYQDTTLIIPLIKNSLQNYKEYRIALEVVKHLPPKLQIQLFDELYMWAIESETKSSFNKAQEIILSLPRDWLIEKLQEKAKEILNSVEPEITTDMLTIFFEADKSIARLLVEKALRNEDKYSQSVGKHFLALLENEK